MCFGELVMSFCFSDVIFLVVSVSVRGGVAVSVSGLCPVRGRVRVCVDFVFGDFVAQTICFAVRANSFYFVRVFDFGVFVVKHLFGRFARLVLSLWQCLWLWPMFLAISWQQLFFCVSRV